MGGVERRPHTVFLSHDSGVSASAPVAAVPDDQQRPRNGAATAEFSCLAGEACNDVADSSDQSASRDAGRSTPTAPRSLLTNERASAVMCASLSHGTNSRRPPTRDRLPSRSCIGGKAAAPPSLSSSMQLRRARRTSPAPAARSSFRALKRASSSSRLRCSCRTSTRGAAPAFSDACSDRASRCLREIDPRSWRLSVPTVM